MYVIIGWISGDADEIFEVIKLRSSKECPLLIDVIVVAVEDGKEMKKDQEFLAAWGRGVFNAVPCCVCFFPLLLTRRTLRT